MKNKLFHIALGCFVVFFCTTEVFGQGYDTCAEFKRWIGRNPQNGQEYKEQFDTLRLYVEHCASSDPESYKAFRYLNSADQYRSADTSRFSEYRDWLISVIYLNTTVQAYFCSCLSSIASTYQYSKYGELAGLAILDYQRHIGACYGGNLDKEFSKDSTFAFQDGYDPTHLPPLDSLGLGFLLNQNLAPTPSAHLPSAYLASFTSTPNPFGNGTTLEFTLNRMSYVTLAVYDELGRLVWGDGSSLEAGTHAIHLDGSSLPSGTLYARIATGFGEVRTVKLEHEK